MKVTNLCQNLDRVGRHPDVELLEACFQLLLEGLKKCSRFHISTVDSEPNQHVSIRFILILPESMNMHQVLTHAAETLAELSRSQVKLLRLDRRSVVVFRR